MFDRIDLNSLMLFHEVVHAQSISQAAARSGVPKATISRRLRQLEEQIGAVLVKRGPHKLLVTEVGQVVFEHSERIAAEALEARLAVGDMQSDVRGRLRIAMPFGFGSEWVGRAIAEFGLRYPEVELVVHVTNRWVDVSEEPFDVAVHVGRIRNERLPVRRLAELERGVFVSPKYSLAKGRPEKPSDLLAFDCIALESQVTDGVWMLQTDEGRKLTLTPRIRISDIMVVRDMALAGLGYTILPRAMCRQEVEAGLLEQVLEDWELPPVTAAATYLERRYLPHRIRAFLDLLRAQAQLVMNA